MQILNDDIVKRLKLGGHIADVGVWRGQHTYDIAGLVDNNTTIHAFDTFTGLPEFGANDSLWEYGKPGAYACSVEEVKGYLSAYNNIVYHKGLVQETANEVKDLLFNYVAIDLDLYDPTIFALDFFYNRLVPTGMIQLHDYHVLGGVGKAIDEFAAKNGLRIINFVDTAVLLYNQKDATILSISNEGSQNVRVELA